MRIRGLLYRKVTGDKGPTKAQQNIYNQAYKAERARIAREKTQANTAKIKAQAKRDAMRAGQPKGARALGLAKTVGRSIGKKIENMPSAEEYQRRQKKMLKGI